MREFSAADLDSYVFRLTHATSDAELQALQPALLDFQNSDRALENSLDILQTDGSAYYAVLFSLITISRFLKSSLDAHVCLPDESAAVFAAVLDGLTSNRFSTNLTTRQTLTHTLGLCAIHNHTVYAHISDLPPDLQIPFLVEYLHRFSTQATLETAVVDRSVLFADCLSLLSSGPTGAPWIGLFAQAFDCFYDQLVSFAPFLERLDATLSNFTIDLVPPLAIVFDRAFVLPPHDCSDEELAIFQALMQTLISLAARLIQDPSTAFDSAVSVWLGSLADASMEWFGLPGFEQLAGEVFATILGVLAVLVERSPDEFVSLWQLTAFCVGNEAEPGGFDTFPVLCELLRRVDAAVCAEPSLYCVPMITTGIFSLLGGEKAGPPDLRAAEFLGAAIEARSPAIPFIIASAPNSLQDVLAPPMLGVLIETDIDELPVTVLHFLNDCARFLSECSQWAVEVVFRVCAAYGQSEIGANAAKTLAIAYPEVFLVPDSPYVAAMFAAVGHEECPAGVASGFLAALAVVHKAIQLPPEELRARLEYLGENILRFIPMEIETWSDLAECHFFLRPILKNDRRAAANEMFAQFALEIFPHIFVRLQPMLLSGELGVQRPLTSLLCAAMKYGWVADNSIFVEWALATLPREDVCHRGRVIAHLAELLPEDAILAYFGDRVASFKFQHIYRILRPRPELVPAFPVKLLNAACGDWVPMAELRQLVTGVKFATAEQVAALCQIVATQVRYAAVEDDEEQRRNLFWWVIAAYKVDLA
jgi:hypothetical protein